MKITKVISQWVRIPLENPVGFSIKTLKHREHLMVRIQSDAGIEGVGFCLQDTSAKPAKAVVDELLGPMLIGEDPRDIAKLWDRMYFQTVRAGRRGNVLVALSAIDIALWDHQAKAAGMPLHKLLGSFRDEVPCYASGGYYYEGADMFPRLEQEIRSYVNLGYKAIKIKVGRLDASTEAKRVALTRDIIGPDIKLMVDANQSYLDVNECMDLCKRIEEHDITFFEEPMPMDMIEGYNRLKRQTSIPLATGEIGATRWEFQEMIKQGCLDYVQHDATQCGGVSEWMKITTLAGAQGVTVAPHYFWDVHVHLACAAREVAYVEKFIGTDVTNFDLVISNPYQLTPRGTLAPPNSLGLGIEWDEEAIKHYLMEESIIDQTTVSV
ncbi:mandelate racemase/muconate lactonizing enzyme family protein [Halalkalibacter alkaliphilus]|uniref:Mandelate racemase/muconate lactonizing enzyme family protein n=1 Tax=Halalkalibacter alkaliphilus TaxID=2917993 RepID=A0A9X2CWQ4_9BACI|nr:mandelate racemase/muconate lactonizing enzyme family protein [Halalkalibacter alkaliphilus]MCL7749510.1 mandelate racemase/muconate lactonizing enzyme family protein [Halalkalibacter alkaliphilus]